VAGSGAAAENSFTTPDRPDLTVAADGNVGIGTPAPATALEVAGTTTTANLTVTSSLSGAGLNAAHMVAICAAANHAAVTATAYYSYVAWASDTMSCAAACAAANTSANYDGPVSAGWRFYGANGVALGSMIHHYTGVAAGGQPKYCCCRGGDSGVVTYCTPGAPAGCVVGPGQTP